MESASNGGASIMAPLLRAELYFWSLNMDQVSIDIRFPNVPPDTANSLAESLADDVRQAPLSFTTSIVYENVLYQSQTDCFGLRAKCRPPERTL